MRAPHSLEAAIAEFATLLKAYRISAVFGDRYAGEWPREGLMRHGVSYVVAEKTTSEIFGACLPLINS